MVEGTSLGLRSSASVRVAALPPYWRATVGGVLGTFAMTIWIWATQAAGVQQLDVARAMSVLLGAGGEAVLPGVVLHLAMGVMLGLVYAYGFYELLPGQGWVRGLIFSMLPTTFLLVLFPLLAWGLVIAGTMAFGPVAVVMWIVNQMVYGLVLGLFFGGN